MTLSHGSSGLVIILQIQDASHYLFYQHDILRVKYFQVMPIKTSHRASPPPSSVGMHHLQDPAIYSSAPPSHLSTVANPAFCPHDLDSMKFTQFTKNGIHPLFHSDTLARLFQYHNSLTGLIWPSQLHTLLIASFIFFWVCIITLEKTKKSGRFSNAYSPIVTSFALQLGMFHSPQLSSIPQWSQDLFQMLVTSPCTPQR